MDYVIQDLKANFMRPLQMYVNKSPPVYCNRFCNRLCTATVHEDLTDEHRKGEPVQQNTMPVRTICYISHEVKKPLSTGAHRCRQTRRACLRYSVGHLIRSCDRLRNMFTSEKRRSHHVSRQKRRALLGSQIRKQKRKVRSENLQIKIPHSACGVTYMEKVRQRSINENSQPSSTSH